MHFRLLLAGWIFLARGLHGAEDAYAEHYEGADRDPVGWHVHQVGTVDQAGGHDYESCGV